MSILNRSIVWNAFFKRKDFSEKNLVQRRFLWFSTLYLKFKLTQAFLFSFPYVVFNRSGSGQIKNFSRIQIGNDMKSRQWIQNCISNPKRPRLKDSDPNWPRILIRKISFRIWNTGLTDLSSLWLLIVKIE